MHAGEEGHARPVWTTSIRGQDSAWKSQSERQRTEINGESTSLVWPTLGSRTAKDQKRYLVNGFSNFDKTEREYSLSHTDCLIEFWRSTVKGQGHSRPKHVVVCQVSAGTSKFIFCNEVVVKCSIWRLVYFDCPLISV